MELLSDLWLMLLSLAWPLAAWWAWQESHRISDQWVPADEELLSRIDGQSSYFDHEGSALR